MMRRSPTRCSTNLMSHSWLNRVEERADVGVQYPVHLCAGDPDHERIHRIVRAASRPETHTRTRGNLPRRSRSAPQPWPSGRSCPQGRRPAIGRCRPPGFGYVNPPATAVARYAPRWTRACRSSRLRLKVLLVVPTCQPIHPRCSILLEFKECLLEVIDTGTWWEERGELLCQSAFKFDPRIDVQFLTPLGDEFLAVALATVGAGRGLRRTVASAGCRDRRRGF